MPHSKDILFIIDPIKSLNPGRNTSLGLMEAALKSGDQVFFSTPNDFVISSNGIQGYAYALVKQVTGFEQRWNETEQQNASFPVVDTSISKMPLDCVPGISTDTTDLPAPAAILQRQDDRGDWATQQIVANLNPQICVLNNGHSTLSIEDKIGIIKHFPHLCPPSTAATEVEHLISFAQQMQKQGDEKLILKATQSYGGKDVQIIKLTDENWQQRVRDYAQEKAADNRPIIVAQKFLLDVKEGDLRIFFANGTPIAALNRVPSDIQSLANVSKGATRIAIPLDKVQPAIMNAAQEVADWGQQNGLIILGIDVIGKKRPYITELNPGSPGIFIEVQKQLDVYSKAWAAISTAITEQQIKHGLGAVIPNPGYLPPLSWG